MIINILTMVENKQILDDGKLGYAVGIKHLIECNCVLPQFQNRKDPLFHKFIVFSIVDKDDNVDKKAVICNNCGIIHTIKEIGKSEITRSENLSSLREVKDVALGLPQNIVAILEENNCDLSTYEEIEFILENNRWGSEIVIKKDQIDGKTIGKTLMIKSPILFKLNSFTRQDTFDVV